MRVLPAECIPRKLRDALPDHECETAPEAGPAGKKNGILLSLAEAAGFELFFTMDKGLSQLATGRYTAQVNIVDETGRKFAFARTEIVVLPNQKPAS